jgi:hypothetical protein
LSSLARGGPLRAQSPKSGESRGLRRKIEPKFRPAFDLERRWAAFNRRWAIGGGMRSSTCSLLPVLVVVTTLAAAQSSGYKVIPVADGGSISGTIRWSGPVPHQLDFPVTKDPQICDPEGKKSVSLERLILGPEGGVANTVVYLKNISAGKAMDLPEQRRHLDQKHCRYIPHILLVPENAELQMQSSDATLHTIHMDGAASYNLPFPFTNQISSRKMGTPGLVNLRCNGGHVWMNAEMMVVEHPYYTVTDESGRFEFTRVPPGAYEIVAWHEGWGLTGKEQAYDVLTERTVERPVFTEPKTWSRSITVNPNAPTTVNFVIGNK